jgi:4-diphosphocytidyl-2-C-methyl-D-erythritol kinase
VGDPVTLVMQKRGASSAAPMAAADSLLTAERKAPAKLNLSLRIVGRRPDGYHLLESIMVPVGVFDDVRASLTRGTGRTVEICSAGEPEISAEDNLAFRAARLFLDRAPATGHVIINLQKHIPVGAGLGGGSSDAAAVLLALDQLFRTRIGTARLAEWGFELGADVPFFVHGCPARVRGVGEIVEPLAVWPHLPLVVACAAAGLPTATVYSEYDRALTKAESASIKYVFADPQVPLQEWMVNDLEAAANKIRPEIHLLKRRLLELGAVAAAMTGSGSAVFGVWHETEAAVAAAVQLRAEGIWGRAVEIVDRRSERGR